MGRKRQARKHAGLFDVPDRRPDDRAAAADGESVGLFGGPAHDSGLLGGPGRGAGLFDAPDRAPGEMPGLFDLRGGAADSGRGLFTRPKAGDGKSVGLFDKPRREGRT